MKLQRIVSPVAFVALALVAGIFRPGVQAADVFVQSLTTVPSSTSGAGVTSFALDADGNRYLFGEISGQVTFATNLRLEGNGYFVARQNRDETWAWVKLFEGLGARPADLTVVGTGIHAGVYVAGHATSNPAGLRYDGQPIPTEDPTHASFVIRLNRDDGSRDPDFLLLLDQGRGGVAASRIRSDGTSLYVGGTLDARVKSNDSLPDRPEDHARFRNPGDSPAALRASNVGDGLWANESDLWIARFDLGERRWKWVFVYGGPRDGDALFDLEVEATGIHFAGSVSGETARPNVYGYRLYDQTGAIVAGLDAQGNPVGGPNAAANYPLPPRSPGIRQAVVGTLHPTTGNLRQFNQAQSPSGADSAGMDLAVGNDVVYLAGAFRNTLTEFARQSAPFAGGDPLLFDGSAAGGGGFVARLAKNDLRLERLVQLDPARGYLDSGRAVAALPDGDVFVLGIGEGDVRLRDRTQTVAAATTLLTNPAGFAFCLTRLNADLGRSTKPGWPLAPEGVGLFDERGFRLARGLGVYTETGTPRLFLAGYVGDGQLRLRTNPEAPETREILAAPDARIPVLASIDPASGDPVFRATVLAGTLSLQFSTEILRQTVGPDGSLYVVGRFGNGVVFDDNIRLTGRGHYLAKMAPDGHWVWAKALAGTARVAELTCVAASSDRLVVGGNYQRDATSESILFDGLPLHEATYGELPVLPSAAAAERARQGFVLWLDHDGNFQRLARIEPVWVLMNSEIATFPATGAFSRGSVAVTAFFPETPLPQGGQASAGRPIREHVDAALYLHASSEIKSIAINDQNLVSVGGVFQRQGRSDLDRAGLGFRGAEFPVLIPPDANRTSSAKQMFVAQLDSGFRWKWSVAAGGFGREDSNPAALRHNDLAAVAIADDGATYFAGTARSKWSLSDPTQRIAPSSRSYDTASRSIVNPVPPANVAPISLGFGKIDPSGVLRYLDFDFDGGEANAISYATDLVLTQDSVYLAGTFLGNTLDSQSSRVGTSMAPFDPVAQGWSNPWTAAHGDDLDPRNQMAFVWRFDRTPSIPVQTAFAFLKSASGSSFSSGLSLAADRNGIVYFGGITRQTSGLRLFTDRSQTGAGTDLGLPETSESEELPFLLALNPDLSFAGRHVRPAKTGAFPLPDSRYPRFKTPAAPSTQLGATVDLTWPIRLAFDATQHRLYWGGNYANGAMAFGGNPRSAQGPRLPAGVFGSFITAVDVDPQSSMPFLEQVTVSVESAYGSHLVDRRPRTNLGGATVLPDDFTPVSFVEPTGGKGQVRVFKGSRVTVRVPYEIYVSPMRQADNPQEFVRDADDAVRVQVHDVLWSSSDLPRPLSDYAAFWPNYPRTVYRCTGYTSADSVVSGVENSHTLTAVQEDVQIRFHWEILHSLHVASLVVQATPEDPMLTSSEVASLGNLRFTAGTLSDQDVIQGVANPFDREANWKWGANWIREGENVQVTVLDPIWTDVADLPKTRFTLAGYETRQTSDPEANAAPPVGAPLKLQLGIFRSPTELLLKWKKQVTIGLGSMSRGADFAFVDVLQGPAGEPAGLDWIQPLAGRPSTDSVERWFDAGSRVYIGAVYQPGQGLQLKGWNQGSGHFLDSSGTVFRGDAATRTSPAVQPSTVLTRRDAVSLQTADGTVSPSTAGCRPLTFGVLVEALSQPTHVTWEYDDVVFRFDVPIGEAFDPSLLNRSRNDAQARLEDWATTEVDACNLPEEILTEHGPTLVAEEFLPAGTLGPEAFEWDAVSHTLFPLKPGRYTAQFRGANDRKVRVELNTGFYGDPVSGSERFAGHPLGLPARRSLPLLGANNTLYHDAFRATAWPPSFKRAHYRHIAGAPAVPLDPDNTDAFQFLGLAYSQDPGADRPPSAIETPATAAAGRARVTDGRLSYPAPGGRGVLVFTRSDPAVPGSFPATGDRTRERIMVRVVDARSADAPQGWTGEAWMLQTSTDGVIGSPLKSAFDTAGLGTGWLWQNGHRLLHNPTVYHRDEVRGPIIPVNRRSTPWHPNRGYSDEIVVVWYENLAKATDAGPPLDEPSIDWPYQPVHYPSQTLRWPAEPGVIVMASRLGSEGLKPDTVDGWRPQLPLAPPRYTDVSVYHQPDRDAQGFNPNEEHALVAPSVFAHAVDDTGAPQPDTIVPRGGSQPPMAAFAFQNGAFNTTLGNPADYTSEPYVLVQFQDNETGQPRMAVYRIERENSIYRFRYPMTVGEPILAPYPLQDVIGLARLDDTDPRNDPDVIDGTYYLDGSPDQAALWRDPRGVAWAISGPTAAEPAPHVLAGFYYPLHSAFWHPTDRAGAPQIWLKDVATEGNGSPAPGAPGRVRFDTVWPANPPILKLGETLTHAGGEYRSDHPTSILPDGRSVETPGLPGLVGWAAGAIVFDSRNPTMRASWADPGSYSARLVHPLLARETHLDVAQARTLFSPASDDIQVDGLVWRFERLSASLQRRIYFDPLAQTQVDGRWITGRLGLKGYLAGRTLGDPRLTETPASTYLLEPDILTSQELDELRNLYPQSDEWVRAVVDLHALSRNPRGLDPSSPDDAYLVGITDEASRYDDTDGEGRKNAPEFGPGLALVPNGALLNPDLGPFTNYVTLVENAHPGNTNLGPVTLHVVQLNSRHRYRGALQTVLSPNVFDEKVVLRHTADFGADLDEVEYEWWYRPSAAGDAGTPSNSLAWQKLPGQTRSTVVLEGLPTVLLGDHQFFARYRHHRDPNWSANPGSPFPWEWAGAGNSPQTQADGTPRYLPQLVMGWVKRVLDRVNPYEARFSDFRNQDSPVSYASMIRQAGPPYRGPVALNPSKDVIENVGLIELYQTILDRSRKLSIDLSQPAGNSSIYQALLLAATRLSDLYMLLGNEAYSDAQDPTLGLGSRSVEYGSLAPAVFAFQNQQASLLHEELALLRGTDFDKGYPVQNRLFWNFVKGEGEAAYAVNYAIDDVDADGFVDENDARLQFPQGHGDAWGHYLSAIQSQYSLIQHPFFRWEARPELYSLLDVVLDVDYLDEAKFARTAAARARAAAEIVDATYRSAYVADPEGQWQGYTDPDHARAWGVAEWATRAGQAALFDWVTANALLPYSAGEAEGLARLDRGTVTEISEVSALHARIQSKLDGANQGSNPLGLADDAVPFDIDPALLERGNASTATHFEQILDRARKASQNALAAFDHANATERRLRQVHTTSEALRRQAIEQDRALRDELIALYGTPHAGQIGPGKPYPAGYRGPDLLFPMYVAVASLTEALPTPTTTPSTDSGYRTLDQETEHLRQFIANQLPADFGDPKAAGRYPFFAVDVFDRDGLTTITLPDDYQPLDLVRLPIQTEGYAFQAPAEWGHRARTGKLQEILDQMIQAEAELANQLREYDGFLEAIRDKTQWLEARTATIARLKEIDATVANLLHAHGESMVEAHVLRNAVTEGIQLIQSISQATAEFFPKVIGAAAVDSTSGFRGGVLMAATLLSGLTRAYVVHKDREIELDEVALAWDLAGWEAASKQSDYALEIRQLLKELEQHIKGEGDIRLRILARVQTLRLLSDRYRSTLQEGEALVQKRASRNAEIAAQTQTHRYQDMTLRVSRNDALEKYRQAFELAAKYTYLAAQAYDFETNLDPNHPGSAHGLLTEIVRERLLGQWVDGQPRIGQGGLAGILARLQDNYRVLHGQLGFSNPQREVGKFSLRHELFRVRPGEKSHERWQRLLQTYRVADLGDVPEFRRYCRPVATPDAGPQPGLVIPFGTTIQEGSNFFGWPLGGMDHAYDPSQFATKIRSVGVWFEGYDTSQLALTPRVYLVPAGSDLMHVPDSPTLQVRTWHVVDQKIPVPYSIGADDLDNPRWIPAIDSLDGSFAEIRRFSRFRAFPRLSNQMPDDEMAWDSRLVGRSVWNTRWLLILPGSSLHADPDAGLDTFIQGPLVGDQHSGVGVTDIQLGFRTYAHSGN